MTMLDLDYTISMVPRPRFVPLPPTVSSVGQYLGLNDLLKIHD